MIEKYNPREIEQKWQKIWEDEKLYEVKEDSHQTEVVRPDHVPLHFRRPPYRALVCNGTLRCLCPF